MAQQYDGGQSVDLDLDKDFLMQSGDFLAQSGIASVSDLDAEWRLCSPETARDFSAVGYYFGREIHDRLGVPVGLISTSWGGTRIEPWTPPEEFKAVPEVADILKVVDESAEAFRVNVGQALPDLQLKDLLLRQWQFANKVPIATVHALGTGDD